MFAQRERLRHIFGRRPSRVSISKKRPIDHFAHVLRKIGTKTRNQRRVSRDEANDHAIWIRRDERRTTRKTSKENRRRRPKIRTSIELFAERLLRGGLLEEDRDRALRMQLTQGERTDSARVAAAAALNARHTAGMRLR